jgi:hypothetical protein
MAFEWVIRHQKKVLFVLAVVLIVGWGLSGMIGRLFSARGRGRATDACGRIAGEEVTARELQSFKWNWARVFPDVLGRYAMDARYAGENITSDEVAWAYLGLSKLATQTGIGVSDQTVVEFKRAIYQMHNGRDARLSDTVQVRRWLREKMGMSGERLDAILRERLVAERMLNHMLEALEPTDAEAREEFNKENRAVRVRYVTFSRDAFMGKTAEPSEEKLKAYYEARKEVGGPYFNPPTVQIEYAQVSLAKLEAGIKVSVEEMKKYYEGNKDLYRVNEPKGEGAEAEYLPFPEVKPEIEAALRSREARAKASRVLEEMAKAYRETVGAQLEMLVKADKDGIVEHVRTPFLTEAELLELPGIGVARAAGKGIAELVSEFNMKTPELSPVMSSPDGWFIFRPVTAPREGHVPELSEVKPRVVLDVKKEEAFTLAEQAAKDFTREAEKSGGAARFEELAGSRKLPLKETVFFINSASDANRPAFIDRTCPLEAGKLYGPLVSARGDMAAVVRVIEERPADPAAFAGERKLKRDYALTAKLGEFRHVLFPRTVLKFTGYTDLRTPSGSEKEGSEGASEP